jgi:3-hydroxyethyl bacteriochlorophyllide a dehydrogenase
MDAMAVVVEAPNKLALSRLGLTRPGEDDLVVDVAWSGISTGTERLLFDGTMPAFPGMGYPLVPGYETVGRLRDTGELVFVPGSQCFEGARGLFGGAASTLVVPKERIVRLDRDIGQDAVLLALAATAHHALMIDGLPELIVGHGVVGRLLARLTMALDGEAPTVWDNDPARIEGDHPYPVMAADDDPRRDYRRIVDASGASGILDGLISRLAPKGTIVLAGFYHDPLSFAFPPAFMREATIRIAAEWRPIDMQAVQYLLSDGSLDLDGLITHARPAAAAEEAYRVAFRDRNCLKMVLDWEGCA